MSHVSGAEGAGHTGVDKSEYWFRRIHSLTGFAPLCVFLVAHFLGNMNSTARDNGAAFDEYATKLHEIPIINFLELGILIPLFYHAIYGLYRALAREKWNTFSIRNESNVRYFWQRITGIILFVFLIVHLYGTRFQQLMGITPNYAYMSEYLGNPGMFTLYVVGTASACYHWGNGLWGFLITWGVTTGKRAQDISAKVCLLAGIGLFLFGLNALLGFFDMGIHFSF